MKLRSVANLGAFFLVAVAIACGSSGGVVDGQCRDGYTQCGNACFDLATDEQHCGSCSNACPSGVSCVDGVCLEGQGGGGSGGVGGSSGGGSGGTAACVPPFNTADRCGDCDTSCSGDTPLCSLYNDQFLCVGNCPPPFSVCGEQCVDLGGDPQHCGSCDVKCPALCQQGDCVERCTAPFVECNGQCVNTGDNPAHCGACFNRCDPGETCTQGQCVAAPSCEAPRQLCGEECTDLQTDPAHCGSCTIACDPGEQCIGGTCLPPCSSTQERCGNECFDTQTDPNHCGDCTTVCEAGDQCVQGQCVPPCEDPLLRCGLECVDTSSDPNHCGGCFEECPTGICEDGHCIGTVPGHIVLACMNYDLATSPAAMLLGNAVFLPIRTPVRIATYTQYADPAIVTKVNAQIDAASKARGRSYQLTAITDSAVLKTELTPTKYDVLVVYDQPNAPEGALRTIGESWASEIDGFALAGNSVVVLSGSSRSGGLESEMDDLISGAGLFPLTGVEPKTTGQLYNHAPTDAVGLSVLSPFAVRRQTCTFTTEESATASSVFVITDNATPGAGAPVVIHRLR